ncbi:MAG: cytochrome c oxidase subunit II [Rhizobiaceae bacterium]|nr:cytochrome c oxidase subunit II [Rhizobiaceae bacterium]
MRKILATMLVLPLALAAGAAFADQPHPWQFTFQDPATDIMDSITWFERYTLWFIVPITLFVLALLGWALVKFRASVNPNPSRTSHNTLIEVIWTVGPVIILLFLAVPSFQLLTAQYTPEEEPGITIKASGVQWNWEYEYQGETPLSFAAFMMKENEREQFGKQDVAKYPRLLAVDNEVVVPVNTMVRVLVTANDVIHAFAMPAFGIKTDAVPGRINEVWFKAQREGLYYGQCSELCGKDHAFMPIAIRVVNQQQYDTWFAAAQADLPGANKALIASIEAGTKLAAAGN